MVVPSFVAVSGAAHTDFQYLVRCTTVTQHEIASYLLFLTVSTFEHSMVIPAKAELKKNFFDHLRLAAAMYIHTYAAVQENHL